MIDGDSDILAEEIKDIAPAVEDKEEQVLAVIEQIEAGFDKIADLNKEIEEEQLEEIYEEQEEEIEEILEEAEEAAAEIIAEESDEDEAAEEIEEVLEEAADEIAEVNVEQDAKVAEAAKTAFVAEITNDAIRETILKDIMGVIDIGNDINDLIKEQNLPFGVQTPLIKGDDETAEEKLDRIVCRSGDCVDDIKKDPEFDGFLSGVLSNFSDFRTGEGVAAIRKPLGPSSLRDDDF